MLGSYVPTTEQSPPSPQCMSSRITRCLGATHVVAPLPPLVFRSASTVPLASTTCACISASSLSGCTILKPPGSVLTLHCMGWSFATSSDATSLPSATDRYSISVPEGGAQCPQNIEYMVS